MQKTLEEVLPVLSKYKYLNVVILENYHNEPKDVPRLMLVERCPIIYLSKNVAYVKSSQTPDEYSDLKSVTLSRCFTTFCYGGEEEIHICNIRNNELAIFSKHRLDLSKCTFDATEILIDIATRDIREQKSKITRIEHRIALLQSDHAEACKELSVLEKKKDDLILIKNKELG